MCSLLLCVCSLLLCVCFLLFCVCVCVHACVCVYAACVCVSHGKIKYNVTASITQKILRSSGLFYFFLSFFPPLFFLFSSRFIFLVEAYPADVACSE